MLHPHWRTDGMLIGSTYNGRVCTEYVLRERKERKKESEGGREGERATERERERGEGGREKERTASRPATFCR